MVFIITCTMHVYCSLIHKMMGEACLKEDTLMRVLVIGLTRELPLSPADAMDIADVLVARAANAHTDGAYVPLVLLDT